MFSAITRDQYRSFSDILEQMFKTRKIVFYDQLGWDVPCSGDVEKDEFDELGPVYIVWHERGCFLGCMRLLPTTGPTLLNSVFRRTYSADVDFEHPLIWEGTRTCINQQMLKTLYPEMTQQYAFGLIMLAVGEWCMASHVSAIVTNYEPQLVRIYRRCGVQIDEVGRADGFGKYPVCCGLVEINNSLIDAMRARLGVHAPVLAEGHRGLAA